MDVDGFVAKVLGAFTQREDPRALLLSPAFRPFFFFFFFKEQRAHRYVSSSWGVFTHSVAAESTL